MCSRHRRASQDRGEAAAPEGSRPGEASGRIVLQERAHLIHLSKMDKKGNINIVFDVVQ